MTTNPEVSEFVRRLTTSLDRMAAFYDSHPSPGLVTPVDAIQCALRDTSLAIGKAWGGWVWVRPGEFEPAA